jgi:hypothetical protein
MTPEQVATLEERIAALERGFLKPDDRCRQLRPARARRAHGRARHVTLCRNA